MINLPKMPKNVVFKTSPSGDKKKTVFKYVYSEKHGCPRRVPNGQVDVQELIQSYADDVDFKAIGQMLVDTRDNVVSHFAVNGEVVDVTGQPRNIHEYEALHNRMKGEYEKLPDELKILFGSFDGFRQSYQEGRVGSMMETYYKSLEQPTEKPIEGGQE